MTLLKHRTQRLRREHIPQSAESNCTTRHLQGVMLQYVAMSPTPPAQATLSPLECDLIRVIWKLGAASAEDVRRALKPERPLKESTVRTLLRRMEEKGFLTHHVEGRTYIYRAKVSEQAAAARAVRQVVDRICGGSMEALLLGMIKDQMLDRDELQLLIDHLREESEEDDD